MVDRSKNLCAYNRFDTQDGHGGRAEEHRQEMREIAEQVAEQKIRELVPQMAVDLYNSCLQRLYEGITRDVETVVNVSMEQIGDIYKSSSLRKVLTDNIRRQMIANIGDVSLTI